MQNPHWCEEKQESKQQTKEKGKRSLGFRTFSPFWGVGKGLVGARGERCATTGGHHINPWS